MTKESALFIVATPIGNLADLTLRAIQTLKEVDLIAAEDTRHSARLMSHYSIDTPMTAYHDHSGAAQVERIVQELEKGRSVALISDAGTPLISDPGYRLVKEVRERAIRVVVVPGPCALITALCGSGLPSDRFSFEGFTPAKTAGRQNLFESLVTDERTLIFYESPHRIRDSLEDMRTVFGDDRVIVLARELTKTYETFLTGTIQQVIECIEQDANQLRGEMVLMVHGYRRQDLEAEVDCQAQQLVKLLRKELPLKKAAAIASEFTGEKKNKLYQWGLDNL